AWAMVICAGLFPASAATAADAPKSAWHTEFEAAQAEAERLNLPLLLHFHAEWCGPCRMMESSVLNTPEVLAAFGKTCVAVKVDADDRGDLMAKYGVAALPTDVFVGPDGGVLGRNVGQATREVYVSRMAEANRKVGASAENLAQVEEKTEDVAKLLTQLASHGGIGLDGYSPVSLTTSKVWREGSPEFAWRHAGAIYFMADAEELELFKKDPAKYAPKFSGFDPVILSTEQVAVPGHIAYGSFYEGRLHLHATEESRTAFIKAPGKFPAPKEIEVPAQIARQKSPADADAAAMMGS
ncbi:MAG TPA: thioredoxin family protein, partial [Planctomycetaceae bacterium]